jgi:mitochondrial distribution and morphology protein 12
MSVDIDWDKVTQGPDGEALAEKIRDFIHDKFQQVPLPRFIKSVQVHSFEFGSASPEVEIKDISDPLPDFYEDDEDSDADEEASTADDAALATARAAATRTGLREADLEAHAQNAQNHSRFMSDTPFPGIPRVGTPGIPGGTSNFNYFHIPIGGLSGAQTPLAAVASGTPFSPAWHMDRPHSPMLSQGPLTSVGHIPTGDHNDPSTRPSTATTLLTTAEGFAHNSSSAGQIGYTSAQKVTDDPSKDTQDAPVPPRMHASQPSDMQVVARVKYSGDIRMMLTAEILLDYPMPSFVGIPLKLSITGMTFDGVAIVAYIRKRMHFCFLDPEDAETLVGDHVTRDEASQNPTHRPNHTKLSPEVGLLKEIHIESEIGRQESGKQVLKNVGKVEKFVLEQVRRIFEEEFVFPSFWTFLV